MFKTIIIRGKNGSKPTDGWFHGRSEDNLEKVKEQMKNYITYGHNVLVTQKRKIRGFENLNKQICDIMHYGYTNLYSLNELCSIDEIMKWLEENGFEYNIIEDYSVELFTNFVKEIYDNYDNHITELWEDFGYDIWRDKENWENMQYMAEIYEYMYNITQRFTHTEESAREFFVKWKECENNYEHTIEYVCNNEK